MIMADGAFIIMCGQAAWDMLVDNVHEQGGGGAKVSTASQ